LTFSEVLLNLQSIQPEGYTDTGTVDFSYVELSNCQKMIS